MCQQKFPVQQFKLKESPHVKVQTISHVKVIFYLALCPSGYLIHQKTMYTFLQLPLQDHSQFSLLDFVLYFNMF